VETGFEVGEACTADGRYASLFAAPSLPTVGALGAPTKSGGDQMA